jgi:FKBP-type peptidyl-prolyl cis-trans isomerase FkpA
MMFKKLSIYAVAFFGAVTILSSCEKEYEQIETIDDTKLTQYIQSNKLEVTKDPSGFYYQVVTPGTGENFKNTDSVLYHFVLKSLDGKSFYDTRTDADNIANLVGYADKIVLSRSVPAIRTTILALRPGGEATILLPSYLAFGRNGEPKLNVPSNEPLVLTLTTLPERSQAERDENLIKAFLERNSLNATRDVSGVYYIVDKPGSGKEINSQSTVYPFYTGRLLDGTEFDSNKTDTAVSFPLNGGVIPGWQKALPLIKEGGKMRIFIPSGLAYGTNAQSKIKMNAILDFDVEVRKVVN